MSTKKAKPEGVEEAPPSGTNAKAIEEEIRREWAFGVRAEVSCLVAYVDNNRVLYPAGQALVVHTINKPSQSFVRLSGESALISLSISDKRDLLALCVSGSMASVELWSMVTMARDKVLVCPDVASKTYLSASFSPENKMLVAQGGIPDWTLAIFLVEKGKVFTTIRLTDTQEFGSVSSVRFHPTDVGVISVVGERILRLMRLHDKLLKTWGYPGGHEHSCVCQEWVDSHILLVGTTQATILVLEDGDLRTQLNITHVDLTKWAKLLSGEDKGTGISSIAEIGISLLPRHLEVTVIKGYEGGFLSACGPDKVFVFTKSENIHEYFTQSLVMRLSEPSPAARVSARGDHTITCLTISPNQKQVVAATHSGQLFINRLPSHEESELKTLVFSPLHSLYHEGRIIDMDCCLWKPIIATTGKDKSVRVWDFVDHKLLFQHTFKEDIYSVAMHPTGLHVCVGLTDALHLFHVMYDGVRHFAEFKIRRCGLSKYSWGGQFLATTDANLLTLFSTIFLKRITTLKGHTNKITGIAWLSDDSSLVSCSSDGGIFGWDLQTSSVAWEVRTNECRFLTTAMFIIESEGPTILSGSAQMIYHLNIGQMIEEGPFSHGSATCIAFSPAKSLVLMGTSEGKLIIFKFPGLLDSPPAKLPAHASAITSVVVINNEERMITSGADGVIIIWRLPSVDLEDTTAIAAMEKISHLPNIPEMLVAKNDIENMLQNLSELENYVQYLKKDKTHHLGLQVKEFESIREKITTDNKREIAVLQNKISEMEKLLSAEHENHVEERQKMGESFLEEKSGFMEELRQKLMYEYAKQDKMEARFQEFKAKSEQEKKIWEEKADRELKESLRQQEVVIKELKNQLEKVTSELERERMQGAHLMRLVEASTEVEISKVRSSLHFELAEEQTRATKLREERASLQRRIAGLETEKEEFMSNIRLLEHSKKEVEEKMANLEINLASLRKEVLYRNKIIADREEELASRRDVIENQKKTEILQEHQIGWLKAQQQPAEEALRTKTSQIRQIEEEISDARLQIEGRDRQVRHLSQKLSAAHQSSSRLRRRLHTARSRITRFQSDVANTSQAIHHPKKLREAVKVLAEKHLEKGSPHEIWTRAFLSAEGDPEEKALEETAAPEINLDTYKELLRQRQLLESSVETLQKKAAKDTVANRSKITSLQKENRSLLDQVKKLNTKVSDLEKTLSDTKLNQGRRPRRTDTQQPRKTLSIGIQKQTLDEQP